MQFAQLYSITIALALDIVFVCRLCIMCQPLSEATVMWFDVEANSAQGTALLAAFLVYLALPKLLLVYEPMDRWIYLLAAVGETVRVVLFAELFSDYEGASQLNTIALTLFGYNAYFYWSNWYATSKLLTRWSK